MRTSVLVVFPALVLLGLSASVHATEVPSLVLPAPSLVMPGDAAEPAAQPAPLAADELGDISAGDDITHNVITSQELTANNSGNSITAGTVTNGDINFSANALTGFSGVGNFVSNTGNNNNLQGSISITITGMPGQ